MTNGHGHGWVKNKLAELRKLRNGKCADCGNTENLEFHHLVPTGLKGMGRGSYARCRDISLHPESYVLVCADCHLKRHQKLTKYDDK